MLQVFGMEFMEEILKNIGTLTSDERAKTYKRLAQRYRQMADASASQGAKTTFLGAARLMEEHARLLGSQQNL
ncbi:hypothetical protein [Rhodoplanes sp. Z2-YC6860]|uniref:hypothetical protein n=1 Tax=Rhodoplanes sp. Z2-YC6860 TaxID=674703 RepID=UPI00082D8FAB|nr:hypothetical protein [Rhodoplanes sp. Z2-YC6860]